MAALQSANEELKCRLVLALASLEHLCEIREELYGDNQKLVQDQQELENHYSSILSEEKNKLMHAEQSYKL